MFLNNPVTEINMTTPCPNCKDWGRSGRREDGYIVRCPVCQRLTWPNLGVNLPAGAAVGVACGNAVSALLTAQQAIRLEELVAQQKDELMARHCVGAFAPFGLLRQTMEKLAERDAEDQTRRRCRHGNGNCDCE